MTDKPPGDLSLPFAGIKKNIYLLINPNENRLPRETSPFPQLAPRVMPDGELCLALHRRFSPAPTPHPAEGPPGAPKPAGLVTPTPNGRITGTRDSMVYVFFSTSFCLPKLRILKSLREIRARGRYFFLTCKEFNQHLNSARDAIPPVAISKITHRRPHSST